MAWTFTSDKPVYLQIAHRITASVLSGEYKAGEQLPTVRQLAMQAAVNPNTIQHAFLELESKGLNFFEASVGMFPQNKITLDGEDLAKFNKLVAALEDLDDVQNVYHNVDLPEEDEE